MTLPRATVMVLVPGRRTWSFELDHRLPSTLLAVLLCSAIVGATAQRCFAPGFGEARCVSARELTGSMNALAWPEPAPDRTFVSTRPVLPMRRAPRSMPAPLPAVISASLAPPTRSRPAVDPELARATMLRVKALHLGESLTVEAFDASGAPRPGAFAALEHLMRCRISGDETPIDPKLIRILAQVSAIYDRPIQLVSGHRKPHVIGTKPTSQHALGRAADIRVAGVGIEELRNLVIRLGARGVGLYPEKGFIHVDVREKPRYFWTYSEEEGEEADLRMHGAQASGHRHSAE
jgi:uncharacterized protein YcbK (DUF882 family)